MVKLTVTARQHTLPLLLTARLEENLYILAKAAGARKGLNPLLFPHRAISGQRGRLAQWLWH